MKLYHVVVMVFINLKIGTLYEVMQGIMKRKNWKDCKKIIFGVLAAGTGNAVSKELGI
jgi:diacylglycerol kinase family enzyme